MFNTDNLINSLDTSIHFLDTVDNTLSSIDNQIEKIEISNTEISESIKDLNTALSYYKKSVDIIYERTIKDLENQLTNLIQEVFSGCNYGIHFTIEDLRGNKNLIIEMFDEKFQGSPEDMGGSLETVAGYLFHLMYIIKSGKPKFLFMDEMFKDLHPDYAMNLIDLINRITKSAKVVNVLITHTPEFECIAEKSYTVQNGKYILSQEVTN